MSFFEIPALWQMPSYVWDQSFADMAQDGRRDCEGVAMWLGRVEGTVAIVDRTVLLRGAGVIKRPNQLVLTADLVNAVADLAINHDRILVGQIHSHGRFAGTDLSYPDRHMGIVAPGYLSVVAPDYALRPWTAPEECGVHIHEGPLGWRRLGIAEIGERFRLTDAAPSEPLVAQG